MDKLKTKSKRGFASMDPEKQREIARKGGKSVPAEKRAFSDPKIAAAAGRKGGQSVAPENRSFSRDPALASAAGSKGGHASAQVGKGAKKP
jgi:general stress protein YciG